MAFEFLDDPDEEVYSYEDGGLMHGESEKSIESDGESESIQSGEEYDDHSQYDAMSASYEVSSENQENETTTTGNPVSEHAY